MKGSCNQLLDKHIPNAGPDPARQHLAAIWLSASLQPWYRAQKTDNDKIKFSLWCHPSLSFDNRAENPLSIVKVLILEVNLWISSFCFLGTILPARNLFICLSSQINLHIVEKSCFYRGMCTCTMLRSVWLNIPLSPFFLSCFKFNYCPLWWCLKKS